MTFPPGTAVRIAPSEGPHVSSVIGGPAGCLGSFDYLIGTCEQRRRHGEVQCLRGFEIDCQLVFCRLLHRQVCRLPLAECGPRKRLQSETYYADRCRKIARAFS